MTAPRTDGQTLELAETIEHIETEPVIWVRLAAQPIDGDWAVRVLELTSGDEPPSWDQISWDYAEARFRTSAVMGSVVGGWLRSGSVQLAQTEFKLPALAERSGWIWRASRELFALSPLPWPTMQVDLSANHQMNEPRNPLVPIAEDDPTFGTFYDAASFVFCGGNGPPGGQIIPAVRYRHQDTSGRIESISPTETEVSIDLFGNELNGMVVELAGKVPGPRERIRAGVIRDGEAHVSFPLPDAGAAQDAWVALRDGDRLVDRHSLQAPTAHQVPFYASPQDEMEPFFEQSADVSLAGLVSPATLEPSGVRTSSDNEEDEHVTSQNGDGAAFASWVSEWSRSGTAISPEN